MILADSAVWIDHLSRRNPRLIGLIKSNRLVCHPFVVGEVSLGSIARRDHVVTNMIQLPQLRIASAAHVVMLIEERELWSKGVGYVDVHLLASILLSADTVLWTRDRRLHEQAKRLGVADSD